MEKVLMVEDRDDAVEPGNFDKVEAVMQSYHIQ